MTRLETRPSAMPLVVITGATASGKTRLAVEAAHQLGSEIISADSRQVYRGLDIGTGKDLSEYHAVSPPVRHHLIDIVDPDQIYSLFNFQQDCYAVLGDAWGRAPFADGVPMLLVGGTPLYIASVLFDYRIPQVPENPELRRRLERRPLAELVLRLRRENPEICQHTDLSTTRRVVRALEIAEHARRHPVRTTEPPPCSLRCTVFATKVERQRLHRRIDRRLGERLDEGLVAEVQSLLDRGLSHQRLAQLGLEYREVSAFLAGHTSYDTMVHDLAVAIHRFARRQEIWIRGFERKGVAVRWIAPDDVRAVVEAAKAGGSS